MTFPILSIIVFTPIVAGVIILLLPAERKGWIRGVALLASAVALLLSVVAYFSYDIPQGGYQMVQKIPWLPACGDTTQVPGAHGGYPSPYCRTYLLRDGEPIRVKTHRMVEIKKGDVLVKISSGGGGVGLPTQRPAELVALDVKNGMVSVEAARKLYGVAVDPVSFGVAEEETRRLRALPQSKWDVVIDEKTLSIGLVPIQAA